LEYCYDQHSQGLKMYTLSDRAKDDLLEVKKTEIERREAMFREAEEAVESGSDSSKLNLANFDFGDSKVKFI